MSTQSNRILHVTLLVLTVSVCTQAHAAGEAKNMTFFLGGGMSPTIVITARVYKVDEAGRLTAESLKRTARIKTYSNDAQTTDSAPSVSAYMTGAKMDNEVISISAGTKASDATGKGYVSDTDSTCPANNGTPAMTLLELAKTAGKSVGAVTTTHIMHAMPATTYPRIYHRDGENQIATQDAPDNALYNTALRNGLDVLLGGDCRHYLPQDTTGSKRTDTTNLTAQFQTANYTYVSTGTQLAAVDPATTNKLLGLFSLDHMNHELDRVKKSVDEPSLADMTEKAVRVLQKNGKGYFLMAEGGRVGHALHGTDARRVLEDAGAFSEAIKRALGTAGLSNTLIIVTVSHDHTITINGYPRRGNPILGVSSDIKTGQPQLAADGLPYTILVFGNGGMARKATHDNVIAVDTVANDYLQKVDVQLGTPGLETRGGGDVMLFFSGPGSAPLKGTLDNMKVFGMVETVMGL